MAIYEYNCFKCSANVDVVKNMSEIDKKEYCPKCGRQMDRVMTTPNVHWRNTEKFHPRSPRG